MMKKTLLTLGLLVGLCFQLLAQERSVSGTVISDASGETVPGVNVILKGTTIGTVTDIDGSYTINVPTSGGVLQFSFIGLSTKEVEIGNRSVIDVRMEADVKQLSEVVVTAFGIEREKKSLNFASQEIEAENITKANQPNFVNAIQGKVAGAVVRQTSGMPGASSFITIRGSNAIDGNNQPLFVVDGLPINTDPVFSDPVTEDRVSSTDATSRSLDINPEDIESINVLKGPAAAALYGLRASNGVVIITTKRGKNAEIGKPIVSFSTNYTLDDVSKTPELQSVYAQGSGGNLALGTSLSWGPKISELGTYTNNVGEEVQGRVYDNVSPFFEYGGTLNTDLGVQGRTENGNYAVGVGYTNQDGFIPTTAMERITAKFAGDYNLSEKFSIGASVNYSDLDVDKIASGSNLSNPLFTVYYAPRSYDLWGTPFTSESDPFSQIHYRSNMDNPRWSLANNVFNEKNRRVIGNINLAYEPFEWLKFGYRLGVDYFTNEQKEVYEKGSGETGGRTNPPSGGRITDFVFTQNQINSNLTITVDKNITEDINVNLLVGNELYDIRSKELNVEGNGLEIGGFHNIANTASQINLEESLAQRVVGFYGNLTLGYKNMLFLTATGRNDYASNMPRGNRSFFYPSVGGSFVFSEAWNFNPAILTFGKVRVSYAEVGQTAKDPYSTRNIFIQGGSLSGFLDDDLIFPFGGVNAFTQSDILRSLDLRPQNTATIEFGFDLRFLNNRFGIDYTYFEANATDQIFEVPIAPTSGFTSNLRNAGELKTTGHEIMLNIVPVDLNGFRWDFTANFTSYKNEVIELAPGVENIYLGGFTTPSIRALKGQTYPSIFGIGYLRDDNGNIVVLNDPSSASHGMPIADPTAKKIGDVQPDFEFGFLNTFTYKGFSVFAQVDWRQGGEMYAGNSRLGRLYGMLKETEDRETPVVLEGVKGRVGGDGELVVDGTNDIAILRGNQYWNTVLGSLDEAHVHETSFVRFRELSISYTLPSSLLENMFIRSASISLTGRNLGLWTSYPNFDPETSTTGAVNGQGLEYVAFPQIRSFGGGVKLTF